MSDKFNNRILVAPLDWGLGHSTRCIPIIKHLQLIGCEIIIAAEGAQKILLQKEFPTLLFIPLSGYNIRYTTNKRFFSAKILMQLPKIYAAIRSETKWLQHVVKEHDIQAVISDNRYGLFHPTIPSAIITHQLRIKAPFGFAENILQKINYRFLKKFSECWVPDAEGTVNIAGSLSHPALMPAVPVKYLGVLSRFGSSQATAFKYKCLVVLSGPEPQRTALEEKVINQLKTFEGKKMLVRGLPGEANTLTPIDNVVIKNHLSSSEMETAFKESEFIISRSGYTTVMDICKLGKKAILIPTPGQTEQEYLAHHLSKQGLCLTADQDNLDLADALQRASVFQFRFPALPMDTYKKVIEEFVESLRV